MRSRIILGGLGFALALIACQQIIGLDDFHKCDVEINCAADASDASIDALDAGDASDAFAIPDGVSEASSWARWRMDNTAAEVANGAPDASLATFDAATAGELADNANQKLVWSTQVGTAPNVTAAASFCSQIGYRLPTRIEMVTLLDSTQQKAPFITPSFVNLVKPFNALWTSSYVRPIGGAGLQFWFADLVNGDMIQASAANVGVLCVR